MRFSDDSIYFVEALAIGFEVALDRIGPKWRNRPGRGHTGAKGELFIGNAGTTARFLTAS